jgi:signal peptidase I
VIRPPKRQAGTSPGPVPRSSGQEDAGPLELALIVLLSLALVFGFVRPFVAEVFVISSASMYPTLLPGDRVLAAKFAYRLADPGRGDVVVFENGEGMYIKRVVGVAGDVVEVRDGVLFVDGEPREEPYVDYASIDGSFFGPETVPEDHVFVMGDNRSNSRDSRSFGPVPEEDLLGRLMLAIGKFR